MEVIRSRSHALIRRARELAESAAARREEGRCVMQGERLIADWLVHGGTVECLISPPGWAPGAADTASGRILRGLVQIPVSAAIAPALDRIGGASGPLAIGVLVEHPVPDPGKGDMLYLDGIQDPGNVGSLLRSAASFGITRCIPGPGCADFWSPKVLRAAMGSHPRLQLHAVTAWADFRATATRILRAADPQGVPADQVDLRIPGVWIVGSEGAGLSAVVRADPHVGRVSVPMAQGIDSLNAAVAQGILFYEQQRQRRAASTSGRGLAP